MDGGRGILQRHGWIVTPADKTANPGAAVDRIQHCLINISLGLKVHGRLGIARLEEQVLGEGSVRGTICCGIGNSQDDRFLNGGLEWLYVGIQRLASRDCHGIHA